MSDFLAWIAPAFAVLGFFYAAAVFFACMELNIDQGHPARGIIWRAAPMPFGYLRVGVVRVVTIFLPPPPRARASRADLEHRIEELERDLEIDRAA